MIPATWPELSVDAAATAQLADRFPTGLRVRCRATDVDGTITKAATGFLHGDEAPSAWWSDGCGNAQIAIRWDDADNRAVSWTSPNKVDRLIDIGFPVRAGVPQ